MSPIPSQASGHPLAALLAEAQWSRADLARAVNALGHEAGYRLRYDRSSVARWMTGTHPRPPAPALVAQALSRRCGRLVTPQETGLVHSAPSRPPHTHDLDGEHGDAVRATHDLCDIDVRGDDRVTLTGIAYQVGPVPLWPPPRPRPVLAHGHRPSRHDLRYLDELTHHYAAHTERHGGGRARTALAAILRDEAVPLLRAQAPQALHQQLLASTTRLVYLLATMTSDTGWNGLAQRYHRTALALAHEADDRPLYAVTLRAMSTQALLLGHPHHAIDLAEAALNTADNRATPAQSAFLLAQRAHAHALTGTRHQAIADLLEAERQHARADSPPGPFTQYPRAALEYQRAAVFHTLGDHQAQLEALRASLAHRNPAQRRPYALTQARLAEAVTDLGHIEAAAALWHGFLDHYPQLHSVQAHHALNRLETALARFPHQPAATALRERARALSTAQPATRTPMT
ncbi:hypothetical protein ABZ078_36960 [Streptomyces sp. NPDC006385]|uniref:hypothetical protein n=1 Tax=Streptomyces sp. NPDC006385 TaxID=3156761 RepID=UPI0033A84871